MGKRRLTTHRRHNRWPKKSITIVIVIVVLVMGGGVARALLELGASEASGSNSVNLQKGLIAWYKLQGNYKDSTPKANNATAIGTAPTATTDRYGNANGAEAFNGSGNLQTSNINVANGAYTVSLWVDVTSYTSNEGGGSVGLVGNTTGTGNTDSDIHLGIRDYHVWLGQYGDDLQGGSTLTTNTWYNLVYMIDSSKQQRVYLNGVLDGSRTATGFLTNGLDEFGTGPFDGSLTGSMSDIRVYNRALDTAEVTALYNQYQPSLNIGQGEAGLVGWWKLNGNTNDSTPYGNNGTATAVMTTTDRLGNPNGAYSFNGTSSHIATNLNPSYSQFSVSVWFNPATLSVGNPRLVADDHTDTDEKGFQLMFNNGGGNGFFDVGNGSTKGTANWSQQLSNGQWYYYVGVYTGSEVYAYLNGVLVGSAAYSGGLSAGTDPLSIGYNPQYSGDYFDGSMSDVRIYNKALSAAQITAQYDSYDSQVELGGSGISGSVSLGKGLVGYWPLAGETKDESPYSNNLTNVNGASLTTDREGEANRAYSLNGSNQTLTDSSGVTGLPAFNAAQSVAVWFDTTESATTQDLVTLDNGSAGNQYRLTGNVLQVSKWGGGTTLSTSATVSTNTWHLAVFTYNGTTWTAYLDGVSVGTSTTAPPTGSSTTIAVGSYGSGEYFGGNISQVRIYNRALNAAEVTALYQDYQ